MLNNAFFSFDQLLRSTKHLIKELCKWQNISLPSYVDSLDLVQLIQVSLLGRFLGARFLVWLVDRRSPSSIKHRLNFRRDEGLYDQSLIIVIHISALTLS